MKLTIQLVPIPPLHHPDNAPEPSFASHYTTGQKLDLILRSGAILPTTAKVPPHEKPVAWFSTSPRWEPTASKYPSPGKLGQIMTAQAQGGLALWLVTRSGPADAQLVNVLLDEVTSENPRWLAPIPSRPLLPADVNLRALVAANERERDPEYDSQSHEPQEMPF